MSNPFTHLLHHVTPTAPLTTLPQTGPITPSVTAPAGWGPPQTGGVQWPRPAGPRVQVPGASQSLPE